MNKILLIGISLLLSLNSLSAQKINGIVYYLNTGKKVASNIQISIAGCPTVYSNSEGRFIIDCIGKKPGDPLHLSIGVRDGKGKEVRHINDKSFTNLFVPRSAIKPLEIYIAYKNDFENEAARYYGILSRNNELSEIKSKILENQRLIKNQSLSKEKEENYRKKINDLENEKKRLKNEYKIVAETLASINKDNSSEMMKEALADISKGNIDEAINIINTKTLEKQYKKIREKVYDEAIGVIEAYELKISLLKTRNRYEEIPVVNDEIFKIYENIWNEDDWDRADLADEYFLAAAKMIDIQNFEYVQKYALKAIEIVENIYSHKGNDVYEELEYLEMNLGYTMLMIKYYLGIGDNKSALSLMGEKNAIIDKLSAYNEFGDYKKVNNLFNVMLYTEVGDMEKADSNLNNFIGDLRKNESSIIENVELYHKYGDKHVLDDLMSSYYFLSLSYLKEKDDKAEFYKKKYFELEEQGLGKSNDALEIIRIYYKSAVLKYAFKDYEGVISYGDKLIELFKKTGLSPNLDYAYLFSVIANSHEKVGDVEKYIKVKEESIRIFEEAWGSNIKIGNTYYDFAENLLILNKYPESENIFKKALGIYKPLNNLEIGVLTKTYLKIGLTLDGQKKNEAAFRFYNKALDKYRIEKNKDKWTLAAIYHCIALVNLRLNKNQLALEFFLKTLKVEKSIYPNSTHLTDLHIDIADSYFKLGKSVKLINKHMKIAGELIKSDTDWKSVDKDKITKKFKKVKDLLKK